MVQEDEEYGTVADKAVEKKNQTEKKKSWKQHVRRWKFLFNLELHFWLPGHQKALHLQALHLPATRVALCLKLCWARKERGQVSDTELVQHNELFQGFLASKEVVSSVQA